MDQAVSRIKEHFRALAAQEARSYVAEWKAEKIYPFSDAPPTTQVEQAERQVFDIVAVNVARHLPDFEGAASKSKAFYLRMLRQAIERLDHTEPLMWRIAALLDEGSFHEYDLFVEHNCQDFGMETKELAADGVVTGSGTIAGRPVCIYAQDFTVAGGSLGLMHARKITKVMDHAIKMGMPIIGINDSGGARIQEGVASLGGYAEVFQRNVLASGVVPQISLICGPCAGGAAYSPALTDFIIQTRQAQLFITGPQVIKQVTGESVTAEQLGGPEAHMIHSGVIHFIAEDDRHAILLCQKLLSFLPANNLEDPPQIEIGRAHV